AGPSRPDRRHLEAVLLHEVRTGAGRPGVRRLRVDRPKVVPHLAVLYDRVDPDLVVRRADRGRLLGRDVGEGDRLGRLGPGLARGQPDAAAGAAAGVAGGVEEHRALGLAGAGGARRVAAGRGCPAADIRDLVAGLDQAVDRRGGIRD